MKYYISQFIFSAKDADAATLQTGRDLLMALAGDAGFESFEETPEGVNGYIRQDLYDKAALDAALATFPLPGIDIIYKVEAAPDEDWNAAWEEAGFEPIVIQDQCIIHDTKHQPEGTPYPIDITIDARQAFGTGTHETTRMVVAQLLRHVGKDAHMLDCGCGTGVLAIVAAKKGAKRVVAYDVDEWSVENTRHNAAINHVDDNVEVLHGDVHVLSHVNGLFDVVAANINRNVIVADLPSIKEAMAHDATLILSGFFVEDGFTVSEKAGELGLSLVDAISENNWCCLVFK